MPGMKTRSIDVANYFVVTLFRHNLFVTSLLWIVGAAVVLLVALLASRRIFLFNHLAAGALEPRSRTYLRWCFGAFWLIDGILQFQASMPLGLANNVVAPMADGTPSWLHSLMVDAINIWNAHPLALATGVAWFQVGIGLILLVSKGRTGRWAAGLSALWAALIWLIGNGAGGIFIRGATILFGWPGASLFYVVAGIWLFVKPETFRERFSPFTVRFLALLLLVAAALQSLPAAGFWHGGNANTLTTMASSMTSISQPSALAWIVNHVGALAGVMGGGFNIIVILWLVTGAVGLWRSPSSGSNWPAYVVAIGSLFFWLVAEDTGVFGGLATDVNSLLPMAALVWCAAPRNQSLAPRRQHLPIELTNSVGGVVATFATAMIATTLVAMTLAPFASAESTWYVAQNGPVSAANLRATSFTLTDQFNRPYSLGEHPGRVTLLTFLDPVCWTDCPLLARQLAVVRSQLSANAKLDIVAVAINPYHETVKDVQHFIAIRHLEHVKDFYYVTGTLARLTRVWAGYGIGVSMKPTDKMSIHSDSMFIVSAQGAVKWIIPDDPLSTVSLTASSASEIKKLLATQGVH